MARTGTGKGKGNGKGSAFHYQMAKKAPRNRKAIKPKRCAPQTNKALTEIKKQQMSTDLCIPKAAFKRVVKEVLRDTGSPAQAITPAAVDALHAVSEAMITGFLADVNIVALHSNRVTILKKDIDLVKALRSDNTGAQHGGRSGAITAIDYSPN